MTDNSEKRRRGRPKGAKNKLPSWRERFDQVLTELDSEGALLRLIRAVLQAAEGGDMSAAAILLKYWIPELPRQLSVHAETEQITRVEFGGMFKSVQLKERPAPQVQPEQPNILPMPENTGRPTAQERQRARDAELLARIEAGKPDPPESDDGIKLAPEGEPAAERVVAERTAGMAGHRVIAWDGDKAELLETDESRLRRLWDNRDAWR